MKNFSIALLLGFCALSMSGQCNLACFNSVVGNLDASCQYELTPADADPSLAVSCPTGVFQIEIYDDLNNLIPSSPFVDGSYIGVNLTYTLTDLNTNTSCFGNLMVDDKLAPMVFCNDLDVECFENNVILPTVSDNCSASPTIVLVNQSIVDLTCDPDYVSQVLSVFEVSDDLGNISTCFSNVNVRRPDLNNIIMPSELSVVSGTEINCSDSDDPSFTGYPQINNVDLNNIDPSCNLLVSYSDNFLPPQGCLQTLIRTWTIEEDWCGSILQVQGTQIIEKIDTNAPAAVCASGISADIPAGGTLILPPSIFDGGSADDCSSNLSFDLIPNTFTCADVGTVNVQLIVYDECGNSSTCNTTVTIMDNSNLCPPPALLQITGPITESEDFCAGQDIESDACLKPNVNVSYTAPVSILLEAGFEVPSSSDFEAIIDVCF